MRKTDKKLDNELIKILTHVCETELKSFIGFQWLTHTTNYSNFPKSLRIICVFDNNQNLQNIISTSNEALIRSAILKAVAGLEVKVKHSDRLIDFDTQENCDRQHDGNWAKRLN